MELTSSLHAFLWTSPTANNCNTYLIRSPEKTILIDPGHAAYFGHVRDELDRIGLTVDDIDLVICTHAHPDHIEAVQFFNDAPARFALHAAEWALVEKMAPMLKASMDIDLEMFRPDFFLEEGELTVGDISLEVFHTPGHSPGGITLFWSAEKALITGDLIFKGGLGRTDLPGGDGRQLKESIRRMGALDSHWLLSGHGEVVAGAEAVKANFKQVEQMWFGYV
ncbi:MBL fold metallo-hydrolase [uncultured Desulfosarcina sp.]|uniref:MBL fold metallo-hydrolase n=1 Tax=uncultured Desulfosarcina sp. TaxID=218289 RepID=UPI0029C94214|nr:MBL fold metallo-hydrolase [uncultured Desulfosarcina sp.]